MTTDDRDPICAPCGKPITASQDDFECCGERFHAGACYERHSDAEHSTPEGKR